MLFYTLFALLFLTKYTVTEHVLNNFSAGPLKPTLGVHHITV